MLSLQQLATSAPLDAEPDNIIESALETVRRHLGMSVAYLSEFVDGRSVFRAVSAPGLEAMMKPGDSSDLSEVYCGHVIAGRLPQVIRDTAKEPLAMALAVTAALPVGCHISVPIRRADGSVYGTFCCLAPAPNPSLNARDLEVVQTFADLSATQINRSLADRARRASTLAKIRRVIDDRAFEIAYQPIHDLVTHEVTGFEALCRFAPTPYRPPNLWLDEAAEVGLGTELEVAVAGRALEALNVLPDQVYVAVNASPGTVVSGLLHPILARHPPSRIVLEITEHASVADYGELASALAGLRASGVRLAVDDAGAGYSGLQHILRLRPDLIKLDMALTRDIDTDHARRSLATALLGFAHQTGAVLIAEGIETQGELATLTALGVTRGQGYLLGQPAGLKRRLPGP